jgi:alpha/beta superfamily hydrolase
MADLTDDRASDETADEGRRAPRAADVWLRWEPIAFRVCVGLLALHVVDDNFLQPEPGVSPADHLVSGLVPLGVLVILGIVGPVLRPGLLGFFAILTGVFGVTMASEAAYYTSEGAFDGDDLTGWLCVPAGLLLIAVGFVTMWRSRRRGGNRAVRYLRRLGQTVLALVVGAVAMYAIGQAYVFTHTMRAAVPEPEADMVYDEVSFTTSDGLDLEGWYVPSENGAAVIVFPGRVGRQEYARMLARHGYGVLLFDRRGEGASDGDPNLLGWGGDRDLKAAVAFLQSRPDVDDDRIGGIGLSVGGEMLLEAAAETDGLQAVVSEGAGARSYREVTEFSEGTFLDVGLIGALTGAVWVFSNEPVPANINDLVADISPASVFFVYGEEGQPQEIDLNPTYYESANEPKQIWEVPDAAHISGLQTQPAEYERRVVAFFDNALAPE